MGEVFIVKKEEVEDIFMQLATQFENHCRNKGVVKIYPEDNNIILKRSQLKEIEDCLEYYSDYMQTLNSTEGTYAYETLEKIKRLFKE